MKKREYKEIDGILYIKCNSCGKFKEANTDNFRKKSSLLFGLTSDCKECLKDYGKLYYNMNNKSIREKHREWFKTNRDSINNNKKRYYQDNKERINNVIKDNRKKHIKELGFDRTYFHRKANYFAKKNNLKPKICPICGGSSRIELHHPSYKSFDKWSEVVFCCQSCHQNIHSGNIECPIPINMLVINTR